jgi:hypothetical protein
LHSHPHRAQYHWRFTSISAIETTGAPNKHSDLNPAFAPLVEAIFARTPKRRFFLFRLFAKREAPEPIEGLNEVLESHDPRHVSTIVDQIRRATELQTPPYYVHGKAWIVGSKPSRIASALAAAPGVAYALSTVWSGHIREHAIRSIKSVPGPFCLSLLVFRMNDWVAQVRRAAEEKLTVLGASLDDALIIGCIEYLWEFERVGRAGASARRLVDSLIGRPGVLAALREEGLDSATDRTLRLTRHLLRTSALDADLETLATKSQHPSIRAMATRALLAGRHRWRDGGVLHERELAPAADRVALARRSLEDRSALVQLAGLEHIVAHEQDHPDRIGALLRYAAHRRNALAELAQWALAKGGVDWAPYLRGRLVGASGVDRNVARVLGRHGNAQDGERILLLTDSMPDSAAVTLLGASAMQDIELAIQRLRKLALNHGDIAVARSASAALLDARKHLDVESLKSVADRRGELFARGLSPHLTPMPAMDQINILARLERSGTDFDERTWRAKVLRKINRAPVTMSDAARLELRELFAQAPRVADWVKSLAIEV